ncbi:mono/diheme cytochrome c family protein [Pelomonas saccharophila]|uniref:Mono/diheme cytochrome c family protein n=1 Tax=Roseateles saccharophilus TaxID=304 RepID=A0ABU1YFN6_ROSSA|nr:c-type cytochrome [Roseateles saccharophilus]MDR7267667.1 mono/diheme cytochrome c family protein [Roseateles saccharophilus]
MNAKPLASPRTARTAGRIFGLAAGAALTLAALGCAVEVQNAKPAQDVARRARPDGDLQAGWRVFQQKCAGCHGAMATGTANGPDLLPRLREMGAHQFVGLVLRRYDWILAAAESSPGTAMQDSLVEKIVQGREGTVTMPAWQGDPAVTAHIIDLYAYLSARAEGTQGPGRPR